MTEAERRTCGTCRHGVPCGKLHKGRGVAQMEAEGWLSCEIRQSNAEERSRYVSPSRAACGDMFRQKA